MGKHEVGTPKYIANKIKSKGLQKLRWYCQMCQKQCRDENGFKCHTMSEAHHRQLLLFADNQNKYMDEFSQHFSQEYLHLLKRQFGTRRVPANRVYQEYIADRGHVHMNATQWLTLTAFVKWLGRTGQCVVDETEKGWYITYIDRDPETLAAQERKAKKQKMDKDDDERMKDFIEKQIKKAKQQDSKEEENETTKTPLVRSDNDAPLVLDISIKPKPKLLPIKVDKVDSTKKVKSDNKTTNEGTTTGWLRENLIVKVITNSLGKKYYKAKGVVQIVENNNFVAKLKLKTPEEVSGHILRLDQEHLETVIPAIDKKVVILWGKHKGKQAIVKKLYIERYCIDVQLEKDKVIETFPYEQVCKCIN